VRHTTFLPTAALQPFVASFAISEEADESTYKVLPDTGVVIGFQYGGSLAVRDGESFRPLQQSGITGLRDSYRMFKASAHTASVLVYFREGGAAAFFNQPIHELFSESMSLENLLLRSELLTIEERLCAAKGDAARIAVVEEFLLGRLRLARPDPMVMAALSLIHKSKGQIRMKELATQLHSSASPLEKRFRQVVGCTPKKFARIVQMKDALGAHAAGGSLTALGYEAGFYDQSHFIREFKAFTGETPEAYFSGR